MSNQIVITSGAKVRGLNGVLTGTSGIVSSVPLGAANGVATLDSGGKVPVSQLPSSVVTYLGTWNAATNTPTLTNGVGDAGDMYICNVAGTVNFGAGPVTFAVGDWVLYGSGTWQKSNGQNGTVTSVGLSTNGGAITIGNSPISTSGTITANFNGTNLQYVNGAGNLTTFPTLMTSVGLTMPSAFTVTNSPLTGAGGTLAVTGAGVASQYIRGDGTLASFPTGGGGGSSVSYYLNGGTNQGTFVGNTYYEMSKNAVIGTGVDFTINANGYISQFITDANDPAQLVIPAGNWNFEMYFSASSGGGSPSFYVELYKYNGSTFTLIADNSANPEYITNGTAIDLYTTSVAVPETSLTITDRLAIRVYVTHASKTITLHTQNSHLCEVITTFSTGITALNGLTAQVQYFQTGTSGTDFNISSTTATHTFNLPTASAANRGALSSADWSVFNAKQNAITLTTTGTSGAATLVGATLNIPQYQAAGTYVTSVTGTSPIVSSGGTTPAISIPAATSSVDGYLTSTDWNTFNGKIGGGGTTNYIPKFSGTFSISDSIIYDNSGKVLINTTDASIGHRLAVYSATEAAQLRVMGLAPSVLFTESTTNTNTYSAYLGVVTSTNNFYTGSFVGDFVMSNNSNYGIAFAVNNSQKLRIANTGAATFASSVTATSFVKTGGTSAQFLKADGSVDSSTYLTTSAAASTYLPLAGGTLTGALSGTSATFSGEIKSGDTITLGAAAVGGFWTWGATTSFLVAGTGKALNLNPNGSSGSTGLSIATTGAATFSSSVTTSNGIISNYGRINGRLFVTNEADYGDLVSTAGMVSISYYPAGQEATIRSRNYTTATNTKLTFDASQFNFAGGNVGIGTSSPSAKLSVSTGAAGLLCNITDGVAQTFQINTTSTGFDITNPNSGYISFSNTTERMRITSGGNVGIGTASPYGKFQVYSTATSPSLTVGTAAAAIISCSEGQELAITANGTAPYGIAFQGRNNNGGGPSGTSYPIIFNPLGGNVGIGTSSPSGKLMLFQGTAGNVFQNIVSNQGSSTQVGINLSPSMTESEVASNPAQASIYATDSNYGANIIFASKATGAVGNALTERMRITSDGNLLLGTTDNGSGAKLVFFSTTAAQQLKAAGTAPAITFSNTITSPTIGGSLGACTSAGQFLSGTAAGDMILINQFTGNKLYITNYSGGVYLTQGATSWTANSDIRLKNINSHIENAVEKLSTLQTINFSYKDDKFKKQNLGLIAQEVEKIFPELIDKNGDGMLGVRYTELVPVLIKAVQELKAEIETLKNK